MKRIPSNILYNILERNGLEPTDKNKYFLIRCPACNHKEAFLYKDSTSIICNRRNKCGYTEDLFDFLKESRGLNKINVLQELGEEIKEELEITEYDEPEPELEIPKGIKFFFEVKSGIMRDQAYNYLKTRNIPDENIEKLGYIFEPSSYFNKTIFFPFFENNTLRYFTCRDWTGKRITITDDGKKKQVRYLNPKGISANKFLFNYDEIKEGEEVFLFEGLMDALSLKDQVGTAYIKATVSNSQASKIWEKLPSKIILVPDNDKAGIDNIKRNYNVLFKYKPPSHDAEVLIYSLPDYVKDFNETGENYIPSSKAKTLKQFLFKKSLEWKRKASF